jgi:hypothetical protein
MKLLELFGFEVWRNNAIPVRGRRFIGKKGRGDILGVSPHGLFLNVECKRPGEEPTDEQRDFIALVEKRGGYGVCVESVEQLHAYLIRRMAKLGEGGNKVFSHIGIHKNDNLGYTKTSISEAKN